MDACHDPVNLFLVSCPHYIVLVSREEREGNSYKHLRLFMKVQVEKSCGVLYGQVNAEKWEEPSHCVDLEIYLKVIE